MNLLNITENGLVIKGKIDERPFIRHCEYNDLVCNPIVYRCTMLASQNIASLPIVLENIPKNDFNQLTRCFEQPNNDESYYQFMQKLVTNLLIYGNVYVLLLFTPDITLHILTPNEISVETNTKGIKVAYRYQSIHGTTKIEKIHNEFCPILEICFDCSKTSPAKIAQLHIDTYDLILNSNRNYIKDAPRLGGILLSESVSEERNKIAKRQMDEVFKTPGSVPLIQGNALKWENYHDKKEGSYLDVLQRAEEGILDVFGVPRILISKASSATATSGYEAARMHYWQDTLQPLSNNILNSLQGWLRGLYPDLLLSFDYIKAPAFLRYAVEVMKTIKDADFLTKEQQLELCGLNKMVNNAKNKI